MKKKGLITNQRDKNLLVILLTFIIAFACYYFIIDPAMQKGELLKQEVAGAEEELARVNDIMEHRADYARDEKKLRERLIGEYSNFFYDLNQERILNKMDLLMTATGFAVNSYSPMPTVAAPIIMAKPEYTPLSYPLLDIAAKSNPSLIPAQSTEPSVAEAAPDADASVNNVSDEEMQETETEAEPAANEAALDAIPTSDVTLGFSGATYEGAMAFMKSLENMDKTVIVRNISMSKAEAGIDGQIVLTFYSLPQLDDSSKDLLKFLPVIPRGKANPFN